MHCRLLIGVSNTVRGCWWETYCQPHLVQIVSKKLDWLDPVNGDFCGSKSDSCYGKEHIKFSGDWFFSRTDVL